MTEIQFKEFTEEIIPQQLFHVDPNDIDDETGGKLEEVILVGLIAHNMGCLQHQPLQWFINMFLTENNLEQPTLKQEAEFGNHLQGQIEEELERQLFDDYDCMISTDDFFPSSEEEWLLQICDDERREFEDN